MLMELLKSPVLIAVALLLILSVIRLNVVFSLIIAAMVGGLNRNHICETIFLLSHGVVLSAFLTTTVMGLCMLIEVVGHHTMSLDFFLSHSKDKKSLHTCSKFLLL